MEEVLYNLESIEVISIKNVIDIKGYIASKYPKANSKEKALVFADSVNKIINNNIDCFEKKTKG